MTNKWILDVGILLTAVFAMVGYFYRMGVAKRAAAKTLLFHLLEIRHELVIETPQLDKLIEEFRDEMRDLVGDRPLLMTIVVDAIPREQLALMLTSANADLVRADKALLESYEKALFEYSHVDPVLTHEIRGTKLLPVLSRNFSDVKTSFDAMMEEFENIEALKKHGKKRIDQSLGKTFDELLSRLDKKIRELSLRAGISTWFKTLKTMKSTSEISKDTGFTKEETAEMMETLFKSALLANVELTKEQKAVITAASLEEILTFFETKLTESEEYQDAQECN